MNRNTKKVIAVFSYIFGIAGAFWGLGYLMGSDDGYEEGKDRVLKSLIPEDEEPDQDEKPAIEWAEGGEEEFYKALEEADKEEENESES